MKKCYALLLPVFMLLTVSCDKVTTPALVGKWQLKRVEKNGTETAVDTVWYNFQSESVFEMQIYVPQTDTYLSLPGLKKQAGMTLSIRLEFEYHLASSDWPARERSFTVEHADRKTLTLRSEEGHQYSFVKF